MPAPAIGAMSSFGYGGRFGRVVSAQPLGEARDGQQLYALRVKGVEPPAGPGRGASAAQVPARFAPAAAAGQGPKAPTAARDYAELSAGEKGVVDRLRQRDQQVRQEEKAHAAVAGDLAGPISYSYRLGPDGRIYAVGGSVPLEAQNLSGDPREAERLGSRMAAAAHAATNPSGADLAAARNGYGLQGQGGRAELAPGRLHDIQA